MDSVKWLASLRVITGTFDGFYALRRYREKRGPDGLDSGRPVREMKVKALIASPPEGERIPAGRPCRITGAAWSGAAAVTEVLVSVDGGRLVGTGIARAPARDIRMAAMAVHMDTEAPGPHRHHCAGVRRVEASAAPCPC